MTLVSLVEASEMLPILLNRELLTVPEAWGATTQTDGWPMTST